MTIRGNSKRCQWTWVQLISAATFLMSWNIYFSVRPSESQKWSGRWAFVCALLHTPEVNVCSPISCSTLMGTLRAGGWPVMEKPPQSILCFLSACGNSSQFKEAPSLRSPIVFGGSRPGAALLFPSFQPRLWQSCCERAAGYRGCPAGVTTPTCSQSSLPLLLCPWNSSLVPFFHRRKLKENPSFLAFKNLGLTFCKEMQYKSKKLSGAGLGLLPVTLCGLWGSYCAAVVHRGFSLGGFCTVLRLTWTQPCVSCSTESSFIWKWWLVCGLSNPWTHWFIFSYWSCRTRMVLKCRKHMCNIKKTQTEQCSGPLRRQ